MNAILFYLIFRGKKRRPVLNSESKGKGQVMHPSRLNVNLGRGEGRGFDRGSWPVVGTFDYCQVPGVGGGGVTFEFHPIKDAILDWKL